MDLDRSSVWGSLKQKTRPLLQNFNIKRTKKSSRKMVDRRQRHSLDRRLSVSVPDILESESFTDEETTYSGLQALATYIPSTLSSSVMSLKSSSTSLKRAGEDLQWRQQEAVHTEINIIETETEVMCGSEPRRKSNIDLFALLQRARLSGDLTEEMTEVRGFWIRGFEAGLTMGLLEDQENKFPFSPCATLLIPFVLLLFIIGTSDPYVKFKLNGKTLYKSKVIYKNLNPVWDETVVLPIQTLDQKLRVKVYDRDLASSDFMGSAFVVLSNLELNRTTEQILKLEDPNSLEDDMGEIVLNLSLTVKQGDFKRTRWSNRKKQTSSKSSFLRNVRLSESMRKNEIWNGIVTITLLEGKNIPGGGMTQIFVLLKLGDQKYKSKTLCKSANPQWREQFDFHYFSDRKDMLDIEVWGEDNKKHEELLGMCKVDITALPSKQTNVLELPVEKHLGSLLMLIAVTPCSGVSISDLCVCPLGDPSERKQISQRYCIKNSLQDMKDIGFLQVKVLKAVDLLAADFSGKSDPFCVLELGNDRLQTHTIYKNLNPEWNKVFTFPIKDIHDVLEVTVFDEDGDKPPDFLGKVAIPLLSIRNGQQCCYTLKNKDLELASKGVVCLELDVLFNPVKASIRTFKPREKRFIGDNRKFSKKILSRNVDRVKKITMAIWNTIQFLRSCFLWESTLRSVVAFVVFVVTVWHIELYMVPLALLLLFVYNFSLITTGKVSSAQDTQASKKLKKKTEQKSLSFIQLLVIIQNSVTNNLFQTVDFSQSIYHNYQFNGFVLFCFSGINKFTKKLRNPYAIDSNELLDFLSRVPSDVQKVRAENLCRKHKMIEEKFILKRAT
uniref:Multiple C2 and transmembrane domain-containing protein 2 n=1 Tax=Terrapene triunguis TaxID=2587831 RepID=A0A674IC15_9SAUR